MIYSGKLERMHSAGIPNFWERLSRYREDKDGSEVTIIFHGVISFPLERNIECRDGVNALGWNLGFFEKVISLSGKQRYSRCDFLPV